MVNEKYVDEKNSRNQHWDDSWTSQEKLKSKISESLKPNPETQQSMKHPHICILADMPEMRYLQIPISLEPGMLVLDDPKNQYSRVHNPGYFHRTVVSFLKSTPGS